MKAANKPAGVVFALAFLAYFLTLCPTVYTGDSGELIADAYTLSIPHAPGYPLYCLIGKAFTYIPLGSIAFRVNLMSAFFASLSAVAIFFIVYHLISQISPASASTEKLLPSLVASLMYAYSRTFWSQAVIAEVYTLWICVLSFSFLILIIWIREKRDSLLYLFSLCYGISITCHQLSVFFAPGLALLIFLYEPKIFCHYRKILCMMVFFGMGLCVYLYVPLVAMGNPAINWNKVHDINSFIAYLLRRQYGEVKTNYDLNGVLHFYNLGFSAAKKFFAYLKSEFGMVYLISVFGFIPLMSRARRHFAAFILLFMLSGLYVWKRLFPWTPKMLYVGGVYLLSSYIIIAILAGLGVFYLITCIRNRVRKAIYLSLLFAVSLLPVAPLLAHYAQNDQSNNFLAYDFGKNILETLDKDAILFSHGDNALFILAYFKFVEKARPDITLYDDISGDIFKETPFDFSGMPCEEHDRIITDLFKKNQRPVYITFGHQLVTATKHPKEPIGIVYRILRENERVPPETKEQCWNRYTTRNVFGGKLENKDYLMREIIAVYHMALGTYILPWNQALSLELYRQAAKVSYDAKFVQENIAMNYSHLGMHTQAIETMKIVVQSEPDDPEAYYNLGVAYAKAKMYAQAIGAWEAALRLKPGYAEAQEYIVKAQGYLLKREK